MEIHPRPEPDEIWQICDDLWSRYDIPRGGLKNLGGAGRVLWIEDGRVVDYAWCTELMNEDDRENIELLKVRTRRAFMSQYDRRFVRMRRTEMP